MVDAEAEAAAWRIHPMIFVDDPDFTLHVGDVRDVLAGLPDGSVNCVVTSPPYWGLRDYGTGLWDGGDPDCDHLPPMGEAAGLASSTLLGGKKTTAHQQTGYGEECDKCGAARVDRQLGLEATPDLYVANMVAVFREVRRVLRADGTCWLNLGDSYVAGQGGRQSAVGEMPAAPLQRTNTPRERDDVDTGAWASRDVTAKMTPARGSTFLKPKDLVGIPWRVAFALQADGWYLRSDIVWSKPNPMPESVTDRPTKAHEYVFLLTRSPRYWFDQEAVRETAIEGTDLGLLRGRSHEGPGADPDRVAWQAPSIAKRQAYGVDSRNGNPSGSRNIRSVWSIATQPYSEAHFATFPEELVRRCLLPGCPEWVCGSCGKPRERIVERERTFSDVAPGAGRSQEGQNGGPFGNTYEVRRDTLGWSDCGHDNWTAGTVLDPFMGSGTTALVARRHGRRAVGIELNRDYAALAARRLQQLSLLALCR